MNWEEAYIDLKPEEQEILFNKRTRGKKDGFNNKEFES